MLIKCLINTSFKCTSDEASKKWIFFIITNENINKKNQFYSVSCVLQDKKKKNNDQVISEIINYYTFLRKSRQIFK